MMKTVIIYAHPYEASFNHAVLQATQTRLAALGREYATLDLYADHFNPVYTTIELAHFAEGVALDPLVKRYQAALSVADEVIFIFPIWWQTMPAIVKGFLDKVLLKTFAYDETKTGIKGKLSIQRCVALTTSQSPTWYTRWFGGNSIQKIFLKQTMRSIGAKTRVWANQGQVTTVTAKDRERFLNVTIPKLIK